MINYDGRRFRKITAEPDAPVATYHQHEDLVWADFAGGDIRRGSLTGVCATDGTVEMAYTMVLTNGAVISGHSTNTPELLPDGRIRFNERWERFGARAERGTSSIIEILEPGTSCESR